SVQILPKGDLSLYVNGTEAALTEAWYEKLHPLCKGMDSSFTLGADPHGGQGFIGLVDDVHLRDHEAYLYELQDESLLDPKKARQSDRGFPWFLNDKAPYLLASFDESVKPEIYKGLSFSGKDLPRALVPGLRGKAFDLSCADEVGFAIKGFSALPDEKGTLEFWFKPKDWNNFFHCSADTGIYWFYLLRLVTPKDTHPNYAGARGVKILTGRNHQDFWFKTPWTRFQPGKWTHALLTWEGAKTAVYLDGRPQSLNQLSMMGAIGHHVEDLKAWREWTGGKDDGTYSLKFLQSNTLVDELRVYDRVFNETEAWNAFASYLPDAAARMREIPPASVSFEYYAHSWDMVKKLAVEIICTPVKGVAPTKADLSIQDSSCAAVFETKDAALSAEGSLALEIFKEFPFGDYPVQLSSKGADGKVLAVFKTTYARQKPVWYENTLGEERRVPSPWTPITLKEKTLSVLGREIHLQEGGLPQSIKTLGSEILAAPPRIRLRRGEASEVFASTGELEFTEKAGDLVAWRGTMVSKTAKLTLQARMEFDGLISCSFSLSPLGEAPLSLEELQVDFFLPAQSFSQLICNTGAFNFRGAYDVRMIPPGRGSVWNSMNSKPAMIKGVDLGNFCANIWVGGDEVGLNFSADNDRGWTPDDTRPAHEILREGDQLIYRMNVITQALSIAKERNFSFILLPTPAKP
ncbi:MAG: hypothetical protein HQL31_13980, partial [Planctomycetes bacterium]|nr:hypothetical protein [Planctomycetota bacterium]